MVGIVWVLDDYSVISAKDALINSASFSPLIIIWAPLFPADIYIWSYSIAVSSMKVGKCFFIPIGEHPPLT